MIKVYGYHVASSVRPPRPRARNVTAASCVRLQSVAVVHRRRSRCNALWLLFCGTLNRRIVRRDGGTLCAKIKYLHNNMERYGNFNEEASSQALLIVWRSTHCAVLLKKRLGHKGLFGSMIGLGNFKSWSRLLGSWKVLYRVLQKGLVGITERCSHHMNFHLIVRIWDSLKIGMVTEGRPQHTKIIEFYKGTADTVFEISE